jgi:hypothetical protein
MDVADDPEQVGFFLAEDGFIAVLDKFAFVTSVTYAPHLARGPWPVGSVFGCLWGTPKGFQDIIHGKIEFDVRPLYLLAQM